MKDDKEVKIVRYVLNSAVITSTGTYNYMKIGVPEAKEWLMMGDFKSTIGYQETADALKKITGVDVEVNREMISMEKGGIALVFRLTKRLSSTEMKGMMGTDMILKNCEIGLLRKLD